MIHSRNAVSRAAQVGLRPTLDTFCFTVFSRDVPFGDGCVPADLNVDPYKLAAQLSLYISLSFIIGHRMV